MNNAQKMKFFIKDLFSKCDQIRSFLRIWSHLLNKSLMENFIFYAVEISLVHAKLFMVQSCRNDICLHSVCLYPNLILNKCSTIILSQIGLDFKNDNIFSNGMAFGPTMPANYDEQTSIANVSKIDCNIKRLNMQKYLLQYRLYMY